MKISIITAVYNREDTIMDTLVSVERQDYGVYEHVIQDGKSVDGTLALVKSFENDKLVVHTAKDAGLYDGINKGIEASTGDIVGFMHSDDFFADDKVLSKIANKFEDPEIDGVYGDLEYISASDPTKIVRKWKSGQYHKKKLAQGWMPPHPTLYLRRSVYQSLGLYDTSFSISADYDAILRYLGQGNLQLAYIPEVLVKMRVGGKSNKSILNMIQKSKEDYRAIRKNSIGGVITLISKNIRKLPQFIM